MDLSKYEEIVRQANEPPAELPEIAIVDENPKYSPMTEFRTEQFIKYWGVDEYNRLEDFAFHMFGMAAVPNRLIINNRMADDRIELASIALHHFFTNLLALSEYLAEQFNDSSIAQHPEFLKIALRYMSGNITFANMMLYMRKENNKFQIPDDVQLDLCKSKSCMETYYLWVKAFNVNAVFVADHHGKHVMIHNRRQKGTFYNSFIDALTALGVIGHHRKPKLDVTLPPPMPPLTQPLIVLPDLSTLTTKQLLMEVQATLLAPPMLMLNPYHSQLLQQSLFMTGEQLQVAMQQLTTMQRIANLKHQHSLSWHQAGNSS